MITVTELTQSPAVARQARLLYEDMALVAHLSEVERLHVECAGLGSNKAERNGWFGSLKELKRYLAGKLSSAQRRKSAAAELSC